MDCIVSAMQFFEEEHNMPQSKSHLRLRALCEGAIFIALAQVLSYLKLFELPQGGSITIEMLPIFLYCARWGFGPGMLASFAYSILQAVLSSTYAWTWQSLIGDYLLAFTVLGFAGACSKLKGGFFIGTVVGSVARLSSPSSASRPETMLSELSTSAASLHSLQTAWESRPSSRCPILPSSRLSAPSANSAVLT